MPPATKTNLKFEILIATMHRDSLTFLAKMFPQGNYLDYNILIVNQTTEKHILKSTVSTIRVINSFETGLTSSRNLALNNTIGDICLIADDDVEYFKDFDKIIINSFLQEPDASVITYKMKTFEGKDFKLYKTQKKHTKQTVATVNSVVIAFKIEKIKAFNISFNNYFGLGATFKTADEYIFLRDCLAVNLEIQFCNEYILAHEAISSGQDAGSDTLIFARAALYYKYVGILGYLKLCKYLYFLIRHKHFGWAQFLIKLKIGLKGIATYKKLLKNQ